MHTRSLARGSILALTLSSCTCGVDTGQAVDLARKLCTVWKTSEINRDRYGAARARCEAATGMVFIEADPDKANIIGSIRTSCTAGDPTYDAFEKGTKSRRVRFETARLDACLQKGLAARASAPADLWKGDVLVALRDDPDCDGVWVPLAREGEECEAAWDCPTGTFCEADDPAKATLTCLKPAGAGKACGVFRRCDDDHRCVDGTCAARTANGQDCTDNDECFATSYCSTSESKCKAQPDASAPCPDGVCKSGLVCGGGGNCEQAPAKVADGEACGGFVFCLSPCSVCRHEGSAAGPLKCLARAAAEGPCTQDVDCAAGLYCHATTSACKTPGAADADCDADTKCAEGFFCDPGTSKCRADRVKNESCDTERPCAEGLFCARSQCVEGKQGDACESDCLEGLVCFGEAGAETCVPPRKSGEACNGADQCATGLFCGPLGCAQKKPVGTDCTSNPNACDGTCYKGKCAPIAPELGCLDARRDLGLYFGMGVLMFSIQRRRGRTPDA